MATAENRSPGAAGNKTGGAPPSRIQQTMAPSGHHLGAEAAFPPRWLRFLLRGEQVGRLDPTRLLTQTLRESFNSSLNMAPVIEPSGGGAEQQGTFECCNSIVISGQPQT